jgi:CheY-like chemotaxis protein
VHPERTRTGSIVRVVLAESSAAPGPLHYLLEGEGFQILGAASNDDELARLLAQSTQPDVIVLDAEIPATSVAVARAFAPASEVIVIWPDGAAPPPATDRVCPDLLFEELGPAVRRAADRKRLREPVPDVPDEVVATERFEPDAIEAPATAATRTAARVLVGTVAVIASIIVTMGASFALQGWRASHLAAPTRPPHATTSTAAVTRNAAAPGSTAPAARPSPTTKAGCIAAGRSGPNAHASTRGQRHASACSSGAGAGPATGHGPPAGTGRGSGQGATTGHGGHGSGTGHGAGQGKGHSGGHGSSAAAPRGPGNHPAARSARSSASDHAP